MVPLAGPVTIYMCRRNGSDEPNYPIIQGYSLSLGGLIYHKAHRFPLDPIFSVETIGL